MLHRQSGGRTIGCKARRKPGRNLVKGATGDWEVVIGLEVHAQVASKAKLFSGASTEFGGAPNSHVSLVDAAMPGMLPVINEACIAQAVRTGLGLEAKINLVSVFDRKNYFYPDLPQGYQISQYKQPIVGEGVVDVDVDPGSGSGAGGESLKVGIERLHLEQDAGKSIHDQHPEYSYVDLNRSGVALMEIVSKPDLRSAKQAQAYVAKLRTILRYLGTCDGDMEKGNLRADVNVSVRRPGDDLGTRCEIKNVNSIRFIGQAIDYEARRQIDIIEDGGNGPAGDAAVRQRQGRDAVDAHQGRGARLPLFPRPRPAAAGADAGLRRRPEERLAGAAGRQEGALHREDYKLSAYDAACWWPSARAPTFSRRCRQGRRIVRGEPATLEKSPPTGSPTSCSAASTRRAWTIAAVTCVGRAAGHDHRPHSDQAPSPARSPRTCSRSSGARAATPKRSSRSVGLKQVTDTGAIETAVDAVIAANPDKVAQVKAKPAALGWFVGQVMKSTGGKANPQAVNELLKKKLGI